MSDQAEASIAIRFTRLNQLILGKSNRNLPRKHLAHRDGLLDALFALYQECNADYYKKDRHIAAFCDKYKSLMNELKSLRLDLSDFELKKVIGRGHFGEVQVVREKSSGDVYAMKILHKQETLSQQCVAFFEEERDIMAKSTSPWLTKLQYAFQDNQNLYLIMEFHPGGDMISLLEKYDSILPDEMCRFYLAELVLAIHSLHSMGYVHRDIKPGNILIDRTGHIKLADFGSASKLDDHKKVISSMPVGTPDYIAPEVLMAMNAGSRSSQSYSVECDWWSLGIVAFEMVFGCTPFADEKVLMTYNNIMNYKKSLQFPPEASEVMAELIDLIKNLLTDPTSRLGYNQLIAHPLFTEINWNNIHHTRPPFVPTVTSVDDTSNFDEFEPESRLFVSSLIRKKGFTGENLPFVGFTYTSPFEAFMDRSSTCDETGSLSPSSLTEVDSNIRKGKIAYLEKKIAQMSELEKSLREEIDMLNSSQMSKESDIESIRAENVSLVQSVGKLQAELEEMKQLLHYEREHRVLTEKKASHIVRCMKMKQRESSVRLRAKSQEFHKGDNEKLTLEEQLEEAIAKTDELLREKADLVEDLHDTKHLLLECQQKLKEKERLLLLTSNGNASMSNSYVSCNSFASASTDENMATHLKLVSKLEKKNIQLEQELEAALLAKAEAERELAKLNDSLLDYAQKVDVLEKKHLDDIRRYEAVSLCEGEKPFDGHEKYIKDFENIFAELQKKVSSEVDINAEMKKKLETIEKDLKMSENTRISLKEQIKELENKISAMEKSSTTTSDSDQSSEEKSAPWEMKIKIRNERQERILLSSDLKQENDYLKSKNQQLSEEVAKLKAESRNKEDLLKEKENVLSEVQLDLRVSTRKEQQSESIATTLRERNKELRTKLKETEEIVSLKTKTEEDLREKCNSLEGDLSRLKEEINQLEKSREVEKARLEARIATLRETWENSKDVNQKFAKTQGQYEETLRQNADLLKDLELKDKKLNEVVQENKTIKAELLKRKEDCSKYQKINSILKTSCLEMEEEMDDYKIIIETREDTIAELNCINDSLKEEINKLKEGVKNAANIIKNAEEQREELLTHINELTAELDSVNEMHDAEIQNLQEDLAHFKSLVNELELQTTQLQKELSLQGNDAKSHTSKIMALESQLCGIKEEAARHITQISSLKTSNLRLTQDLEEALENLREAQKSIDEIYSELERESAKHSYEKLKLQETISQQTKLIDFLQTKTENMEKKKKPISRLFGKKDNSSHSVPARDIEKLLENERSRCRRLQDQLSQARVEREVLRKEINVTKSSAGNPEVPVSPMSRAMHNAIMFSPAEDSSAESPVLSAKERLKNIIKPPGMKHNIPHRFNEVMCMRSTKCCACLDSIHFGRPVGKCQGCLIVCHPKCATSLPSTCGLPSEFMKHFKSAVQDNAQGDTFDGSVRSEGWIKVPKPSKQGWDRRYLRLIGDVLYVFEDANSIDESEALFVFDFSAGEAKLVVTSAVSATELPSAATSDLPYVLKVESFPYTTCWPERCLYIMTSNFNEKQMWVSVLERLAEKNSSDVDVSPRNKLVGKSLWSLNNEKLIDPLCTTVFDQNIILLGAVEGLYVLKVLNKFTCSLQEKIDTFSHVYQITCMQNIGIVVIIYGEDRKLSLTDLKTFQHNLYKSSNQPLTLNSIADVNNCHLFATEENASAEAPYLCIAYGNNVTLCQWDSPSKNFMPKKRIQASEPCSCFLFTQGTVIFGANIFYELNLQSYDTQKFLDANDPSLAGIVYGASHFRSFPVAIFLVSTSHQVNNEYLLCFHEMGVFVNSKGQRTRPDDMKWSRLPLSFAYQAPYLFITHFTSVEVIEIPPQSVPEPGIRACMRVKSPHFMGVAHIPKSILIASTQDGSVELILVEGSSIGKSDFQQPTTDDASSVEYSGSASSCKGSIGESDVADLDFSFSTSIMSTEEPVDDVTSISSKGSLDFASSQS